MHFSRDDYNEWWGNATLHMLRLKERAPSIWELGAMHTPCTYTSPSLLCPLSLAIDATCHIHLHKFGDKFESSVSLLFIHKWCFRFYPWVLYKIWLITILIFEFNPNKWKKYIYIYFHSFQPLVYFNCLTTKIYFFKTPRLNGKL